MLTYADPGQALHRKNEPMEERTLELDLIRGTYPARTALELLSTLLGDKITMHQRRLFGVGEESLEVRLFDWNALPTDEIAFPTVHWMLAHEREVMAKGYSGPFKNPA